MAVTLTPEQVGAVFHYTGPAIVIAGPGSGKTRVLIERVRFLIEEKNVKPENILAATFTEKASTELKHRLYRVLDKKAGRVHISTIHSLCATILEDYFTGHDFGIQFTILDSEAQKLFVLANKSALNLGGRRGWRDLLIKEAGYMANYEEIVCGLYNTLTENEIDPEKLIKILSKENTLTHDMQRILEGYVEYVSLVEKEKLMDFAFLQIMAFRLLRDNSEILKQVQERFRFILIDEYQDTSPVQDSLFRMIAAPDNNIFVVGDENQSIYGFRGASVENFTHFKDKYPDAEEYPLNSNFRSVKEIVDTANRIFESKIKTKLKAIRGNGNRVLLFTGDTRGDVALKVTRYLKELINRNIFSPRDIAFLYRKKSLATDITRVLMQEGLSYHTDSEGRFTERQEIRDILNILRYVHQDAVCELEFKSWSKWWDASIFENEVAGFSNQTIKAFESLPKDFDISSLDSNEKAAKAGIKNKTDIQKLTALNRLRTKINNKEAGLLDSIYEIFKITKYISALMNDHSDENEEKLYNIAYLTRLVDSYEQQFKRPSAKGLFYLLYNRSRNNGLDQIKPDRDDEIHCMTVHKAKGLEFPVVVIQSVADGDFPLEYRDESTICGIPIRNELLKNTNSHKSEKEHYMEELRLFYVAVTRAQDMLILTLPAKKGNRKVAGARFLDLIREFITEEISGTVYQEASYSVPRTVHTLSYTSAKTYEDCPFRYKINYIYEFVSPMGPMQRQGIIIHNVLQMINWKLKNNEPLNNKGIQEIVEQFWMPVSGKKADEKLKENIIKHSINYCDYAKENISEVLRIEQPFTYIDDTMIVKGKTDLLVKNKNGETMLIDFKARSSPGIEETGVEEQLNMYSYCLTDMNIDEIAAYTFFDNKVIPFTCNPETAETFLGSVSDGLNCNSYPLKKESAYCKSGECYYSFICEDLNYGKAK